MKLYLAAAVLMLVLAVQTGKIVHLIHLLRYKLLFYSLDKIFSTSRHVKQQFLVYLMLFHISTNEMYAFTTFTFKQRPKIKSPHWRSVLPNSRLRWRRLQRTWQRRPRPRLNSLIRASLLLKPSKMIIIKHFCVK